jgi:hypothetical protein
MPTLFGSFWIATRDIGIGMKLEIIIFVSFPIVIRLTATWDIDLIQVLAIGLLYRLSVWWFHPLRKFPGPVSASFSNASSSPSVSNYAQACKNSVLTKLA